MFKMKTFLFFVFLFGILSLGSASELLDLIVHVDLDLNSVPIFLCAEDLNNDGNADIVIGSPTKVIKYDAEGKYRWEYKIGENDISALYVSEFTEKNKKDIIVGTRSGSIYIIEGNGRVKSKKVLVDFIKCLSVSDIEGDGNNELIVGGRDKTVYILNNKNELKWKFETSGSVIFTAEYDIDNDGIKEVLVGSEYEYHNKIFGEIDVLKNGDLKWSAKLNGPVSKIYFADEKIIALSRYKGIYAYDKNGNIEWKIESYPAAADIYVDDLDKDGRKEIITVINLSLYAYDTNGNEKWRYFINNTASSISAEDIDNDGHKEIFISAGNSIEWKNGNFYVVSSEGDLKYASTLENLEKIIIKDINNDNKKEVILSFIKRRSISDQAITEGSVKVFEINEGYFASIPKENIEQIKINETKKENKTEENIEQVNKTKEEEKPKPKPQANASQNITQDTKPKQEDNSMLMILAVAAIIIIAIAAVFLMKKGKTEKKEEKGDKNKEIKTTQNKEKKEEKKEKETNKIETKEK